MSKRTNIENTDYTNHPVLNAFFPNIIEYGTFSFYYRDEQDLITIANFGLKNLENIYIQIKTLCEFYNWVNRDISPNQFYKNYQSLANTFPIINKDLYYVLRLQKLISFDDLNYLFEFYKNANIFTSDEQLFTFIIKNKKFNPLTVNRQSKKAINGFVYFAISEDKKLIKVGTSINPKKRIKDLSRLLKQRFSFIFLIETNYSFELENYYLSIFNDLFQCQSEINSEMFLAQDILSLIPIIKNNPVKYV